jgi:hypothetical protein
VFTQRNRGPFANAATFIGAFTLMLAGSVARGDTIALAVSGGNVQDFARYSLGWTFTLHEPIYVTQLGWYDAGEGAFSADHPVGLFLNADESLLLSATVGAGDALAADGFRYTEVAEFRLDAGEYSILGVSGDSSGNGSGRFLAFADAVTTAPELTYDGGRFAAVADGTLKWADMPSDRDVAYFGPNFQFTAASAIVPLPSAICSGLALMGVLCLARRRRHTA